MTQHNLETGQAYLLEGSNQATEAFKVAEESGLTPVRVEVPDVADDDYGLAHMYAMHEGLKSAFTAGAKVAVLLDLNNAKPRPSLTHILNTFATGAVAMHEQAGTEKIDTSGVTILLQNADPKRLDETLLTRLKPINLSR